MDYGKKLPASNGKTGVVGFCWGGGTSLLYAIAQPGLNAAVMFYGSRRRRSRLADARTQRAADHQGAHPRVLRRPTTTA